MTTVVKGRWFPELPPVLDGEDATHYTNRMIGVHGDGQVPYDHPRNRQCSIGWHRECSERSPDLYTTWQLAAAVRDGSRRCQCPCHTDIGQAQWRIGELEEALVACWSLVGRPLDPSRPAVAAPPQFVADEVTAIVAKHPQYAEWYPAAVTR